jgi:Tol biopolymer transport system component
MVRTNTDWSEHVEGGNAFTPDLKEFYFNRRGGEYENNTMLVIHYKDNQWIESVVPPGDPFRGSGGGRVKGPPFISPDGKTMHFGERYRERTDDGWSEMKSLGSPYEDIYIMRLTASSKGTYVLDEATSDGNGVLRYSRLVNGRRETPRPFSKEINAGKWNAHPFIAPDESYIIWDGERDSGYGGNDIYISFRQRDGSWGDAINFGDKVNTDAEDGGGVVTPDGKYLFFNRQISPEDYDIYWVDAQIIEMLRPKP